MGEGKRERINSIQLSPNVPGIAPRQMTLSPINPIQARGQVQEYSEVLEI
jgi:hypothetical protein